VTGNHPINRAHQRKFTDPQSRPSNQRMHAFDEHVRRRVAEIALWLDSQQVVAEAESVLSGRRMRSGDPGE
jgi:hypothetical protein